MSNEQELLYTQYDIDQWMNACDELQECLINKDYEIKVLQKALELACEHIKEDLKCDDTENEIYNYFKTQAKEMLENE